MREVSERRISYLADQLQALGWGRRDARDRAVLLAYLYKGHVQLTSIAPHLIGTGARRRHARIVLDALLATQPAAPTAVEA